MADLFREFHITPNIKALGDCIARENVIFAVSYFSGFVNLQSEIGAAKRVENGHADQQTPGRDMGHFDQR